MTDAQAAQRTQVIQSAVRAYAVGTSDSTNADLLTPLTFLLAQVRRALNMDVVFVSRFVNADRVFEVVSAEGEPDPLVVPGARDALVDTYCERVADGRIPSVVGDTAERPEVASLPITARLNIRAYLSATVVLHNGTVFGTVCCISHRPRADLHEQDATALVDVANAVAASVDASGRIRFAAWCR